jgi:hypothetical protein
MSDPRFSKMSSNNLKTVIQSKYDTCTLLHDERQSRHHDFAQMTSSIIDHVENYRKLVQMHLQHPNDTSFWKQRAQTQIQVSTKSLNALADGLVASTFDNLDSEMQLIFASLRMCWTNFRSRERSSKDVKKFLEHTSVGYISNFFEQRARSEFLEQNGVPKHARETKVEIRKTDRGLATFATKDIMDQEVIFEELPVITSLMNTTHCFHCSRQVPSNPTRGEHGKVYCTKICRYIAYASYIHVLKERNVTALLKEDFRDGNIVFIKCVGMALTRNCSIQDLTEFKTFHAGAIKHAEVRKVGHWFHIVSTLGLLGDPRFDFRTFQFVDSLVRTNAFGFSFEGSTFFRLATLINHSCEDNADYIVTHNIRLVAIRSISAGEEIRINYSAEQSCYDRCFQLAYSYGFICDCSKCAGIRVGGNDLLLHKLISARFH